MLPAAVTVVEGTQDIDTASTLWYATFKVRVRVVCLLDPTRVKKRASICQAQVELGSWAAHLLLRQGYALELLDVRGM